jgi:hypothetical protein
MKIQFFKNTQVLFFALSLMPAFAFGGGGSVGVGGGGTGVFCFSIPIKQAFNGKTLTPQGLENVTEAYMLEGYLAIRSGREMPSEVLRILLQGNADEMRHYLLSKLAMAPAFLEAVLERHRKLGKIQDGISAGPNGIYNSDDSGLVLMLGSNCLHLQAAYRQVDVLFYDPKIWIALGKMDHGAQQALLQLHEEIYAVGSSSLGHIDSIATRNLIISLLTMDLTPDQLVEKLSDNFFGSYQTTAVEHKRFSQLKSIYREFLDLLKKEISSRDFENKSAIYGIIKEYSELSKVYLMEGYPKERKSHSDALFMFEEQLSELCKLQDSELTAEQKVLQIEQIMQNTEHSLEDLNLGEELVY